ncbi:MAG: hypothetical protein WAV13_04645 [Thermodesulfovibrionales bacterium]
MPAKSAKQYGMMAGIAHGMKPRSGIGPSQEVAAEMVHKTPAAKRSKFMKALKKKKR